jgi:multidrug efflux pump subunit AcrA (membrane-fusion protein)
MESVTYITEIDIQKIAVKQTVKIKLDADPNKTLTGTVTSVANIGEQRPNSDAKVFEVKLLISESDTTLRPSMTTSNEILVARLESALRVPLECVQTVDSTTFVYKRDGGSAVRQQVRLGLINENEAVILDGVAEDDEIYLAPPAGADRNTILLTRND